MAHTITLIPGDGIGPEVTEAVVRIFQAAAVDIEWERHDAGVTAFKRFNKSLPVELLDSIRKNKVALKGPVTTPIAEGFTSVNVGLRKALDLYANLRPVWNLPSVPSRFTGVDLVIVRENTEDLYAGLEHTVVPGVVESLKIITEKASTRIAEFAFDQARRRGRKRQVAAIGGSGAGGQGGGVAAALRRSTIAKCKLQSANCKLFRACAVGCDARPELERWRFNLQFALCNLHFAIVLTS